MEVSIKEGVDTDPCSVSKRQGGSRDDVIVRINYSRKELFALIQKIRQKKTLHLKINKDE